MILELLPLESQEDFDIRTQLGVDPPCFVRKVPRALICGDEKDPTEVRAQRIRTDVLSIGGGEFSVFYVTNAKDVIRAACALNFARTAGSSVREICLLAFTPEELSSVNKSQTPDTLVCHWAQHNHWNLTFSEEDQLRVAGLLAQQKRSATRFSKKKITAAWSDGDQDGCKSVRPESNSCACDS